MASWFWIGVYLIEAVIVYQYISTLYEKRQTPKVILLLWTFVYFSMFLISKTERVWLNILVFFLLNSLLTLISFEIKPISAIFHSIVLTASMCLTEIIPIAAFSELISKYEKNRFLEYGVVLITLFSKLLFFISTRIMIAICGDKKTKPICDKNGSIINVVPIVSIGIYYVLLQICLRCSVEYDIQIMITLSGLALLIINITVFWEHERVIKKDQEKFELEMMIQKQQNEVEYYKLMAERNEEQKILIHDFKKHMEYIKYLYSEGLKKDAEKYVDETIERIEKTSVQFSDNTLLNVIVCHYYSMCKKKNIRFAADIRKGTLDSLDCTEITSLIGNLLENAFEAVERERTGNDAFIEISVTKVPSSKRVLISTINSCQTDPYDTGKLVYRKGKTNHGIGLKSIKKTAKLYKGQLNMYYDENEKVIHSLVVLFEK